MGQRVYCDQGHPGSDTEAERWCQDYHRPRVPRILFQITPHYDRGVQCGGIVRCPDCGVEKVFVDNSAMGAWQTLHEGFSLFGCRLRRVVA